MHWNGGSRILDPPGALGESGEQRDRAMRNRTHVRCWEYASAQPFRPGFSVLFNGEIERRLMAVGGGNRARDIAAIGFAPALEQPRWRVARCVVGRRRAILRH